MPSTFYKSYQCMSISLPETLQFVVIQILSQTSPLLLKNFHWFFLSSNTMWPGQRPTSVPSGILVHAAVWPQYMGQNGGLCPSPLGAGSASNTTLPGPRPTSIASGILIHPAVWPQQTRAENWSLCPFWWGAAGSPSITQCGRGRGLPPCQVSSWSIWLFGHNTPTLQTDRTDRWDNGPLA